jgi:hypothetical protein
MANWLAADRGSSLLERVALDQLMNGVPSTALMGIPLYEQMFAFSARVYDGGRGSWP